MYTAQEEIINLVNLTSDDPLLRILLLNSNNIEFIKQMYDTSNMIREILNDVEFLIQIATSMKCTLIPLPGANTILVEIKSYR